MAAQALVWLRRRVSRPREKVHPRTCLYGLDAGSYRPQLRLTNGSFGVHWWEANVEI